MTVTIKHIYGRDLYVAEHAADVRAALVEAVKSGAYLGGAYLGGAYLDGANLGGANLRGANLGGAYLGGANLGGAYLGGAYLGGAYLDGANLDGANLDGAYLGGAYLDGAYLDGANLRSADLDGAYLRSADLRGADLRGAYLGGAYLRGAKGINPYRVNPLLMLLDQPGKIRAYKLVTADGYGPFNGGIRYKVGKTVSADADTDPLKQCGAGINVATLDWCMKEWRSGYRILLVEFTAADIAAVPVGDGKFRLHRCKVVGEKDLVELGLVEAPAAAKAAALPCQDNT